MLVFSGLTLGAAFSAAAAEKAEKPNIILIYSDDHGWADLGVQGSDADIRTPHIDQLARDGVRFTRGYVSAPQCVPSRAGVITGRYQQRFGVEDNLKGPLPLAEVTIAERLKPAGYVSAQVGKWHLEPTPRSDGKADGQGEHAFLPGAQGFDEYHTGPMNSFMASHDLKGNKLPNAPQRQSDSRFRCLWQTDAALSFIGRHAREPFFLYLAYFTPHVPLESPEPFFSKTPARLPKERRQALAMIAAMDEGVGQIRARLRDLGLERNTLIFFIGDNGAPLKEGAWNGSLNTPLIGEKGMLTDGGVRVPFVAAWPGTLVAGRSYDRAVINLDVAATATALAGLPADPVLDGVNLMPYLLGQKSGSPHAALFWRWRSQAAVRTDRWKLILLGPESKFLFDLESPEAETKNRLAENPAIAAELEQKLMTWNATLPPPGLPRAANAQDQLFFDAHVTKTGAVATKRGAAKEAPRKAAKGSPAGEVQGWVGRNCTLTMNDGSLRIVPEASGRARNPFITRTGLDVTGPVTLSVRLRAAQAGRLALAWRCEGQGDFVPENVKTVEFSGNTIWQDLKLEASAAGKVIHVRVQFPEGGPLDVAHIELIGADPTKAGRWNFERAPGFSAPAEKPAEKPNIIFILADDLGIVDLNAYAARFTGAKPAEMYYETPHLDRLVREGTAFSQAYACQLCSPTRSSLLTGKNSARLGFTTAVSGTVRTFYNQGIAPPPGYVAQDALQWLDKIGIPQALLNGTTIDALPSGQSLDGGRNETTIAEALKGYHSGFIGKWHVGGHGSRGWQPKDQGFEEIAYFDEGGSPYFKWREAWDRRKLVHPKMPQPELLQGKAGPNRGHDYLTDELTEHAVDFIRRRGAARAIDGKAFLLYFCHFAVHTPFQGPNEEVARFERKATRGWNGHDNAVYAAMLKRLDDSIGRILDTLAASGLEQDTLVAFMSDNGGVMYTLPLATNNAPFRGGKALHFEGGIRVPLVFRQPGRVPAGQWCQVPVDCNDLFPTLLDLAGQDPWPHYAPGGIDGRSLKPLFADLTNARRGYPRDTFYWHYPLNVIVKDPDDGQPSAPHSTIRVGDWKLIFDWSGMLKLYNVAADPFERRELSAAEQERAERLFRQLNDWLDANVAVKYLPALNPDYDPAKEARSRPFVDLRRKYLGDARAIRSAASDARFKLTPPVKP